MEKLEALKEEDSKRKIVSQKFNGDIVMAWLPNLQGKELGAAIVNFKNQFSFDEEFRNFILTADYETIKNRFMSAYNG